jgi:HAD superfamily hydrolase (TIGR01484 family)
MGIYGERDIRLVVSDVEGVITPPKRTASNLRGQKGIQEYCKLAPKYQSPPIILVTGRPAPYVEAVIQDIGALGPYFNIPSVIENGAAFWDHNCRQIIRYNSYVNFNQWKEVGVSVDEIMKKYSANIRKEPGKEVCISLNPIELSVEDVYDIVLEEITKKNINDLVDVTHSASAVDITPKNVNKLSGLECVLNRAGIPFEKVLGIGDTLGDVQWLEKVGFPTGPLNATEDVRKIKGVWIADWPDSEGAAHILQHFILQYIQK